MGTACPPSFPSLSPFLPSFPPSISLPFFFYWELLLFKVPFIYLWQLHACVQCYLDAPPHIHCQNRLYQTLCLKLYSYQPPHCSEKPFKASFPFLEMCVGPWVRSSSMFKASTQLTDSRTFQPYQPTPAHWRKSVSGTPLSYIRCGDSTGFVAVTFSSLRYVR